MLSYPEIRYSNGNGALRVMRSSGREKLFASLHRSAPATMAVAALRRRDGRSLTREKCWVSLDTHASESESAPNKIFFRG
jgi:hypothetical protein